MSPRKAWDRARIRAWFQSREGHIVPLCIVTLVWLVLWAWFDYLVVVLAFPPPLSAASDTGFYWVTTWDFMFPLASMFAFRQHAWLPIAAQRAGAWEDILFYFIQGKGVPAVVSNIPPTGTAELVYARAIVFLVLAVMVEIASHRIQAKNRLRALVIAFAPAAILDQVYALVVALALAFYFCLSLMLKAAKTQYDEEPKPPTEGG